MKKTVLIITALVVIATILFVPVTAKDTGTTPPDPVCNICTKLDQLVSANPTDGINAIKAALVVLQTDVTEILKELVVLQTDVTEILKELGVLQTDVTTIDGKIDLARSEIAAIQDDVTDIETAMAACNSGGTSGDVVYTLSDISSMQMIVIDVFAPGIKEPVNVEVLDWRMDAANPGVYNNGKSCGEGGIITLTPENQDFTCVADGSDYVIIQIRVPESKRDKVTFRVVNEDIRYLPGDFKVDLVNTST